jgi:hypothetical protein
MSAKEAKNVVASVLARLRNRSKSSGAPFQQVLQQYAIERFLFRISKSKHAQSSPRYTNYRAAHHLHSIVRTPCRREITLTKRIQ